MAEKLSKIARELNVGINTIIGFLQKSGFEITSNPNTRLSEEQYNAVAKEFLSDSKIKKESSQVDLKGPRKNREAINREKENSAAKVDSDFISAKDNVKIQNMVKIVDRIDLDAKTKVKEIKKPVVDVVAEKPKPNVVTEKPKEENVVEIKESIRKKEVEKSEVEMAKAPIKDPMVTTSVSTDIDAVTKEPAAKAEEEPFKVKTAAVKEIKVVGTIDLSTLNQLTRPPKKSKQEKERERQEQKKQQAKNTNNQEPNQQGGGQGQDGAAKKKRNRIHRGDEKVQVDKFAANAQPQNNGGGNSRNDDSKNKLKKIKNKKQAKVEIKEEDISKQIKDTFARLGSKGKSQSSKHRRDKRDAVQQRRQEELDQVEKTKSVLQLTEFVTVAELAAMMDVSATEVISICMSLGLFVSINQRLDAETIGVVVDEFGYTASFVSVEIQEAIEEDEEDSEDTLEMRPPIVTVMGHVDHGKTSLLDGIRKTNVIAGEAGGITQHIGAYNVQIADGRTITFLDTPGHEAFTAMRARGAQVTDVAIIIIAADDSVMPQTVEAINHASAAGVPIIFAINKIDKPGVNPDKIREELAQMNYLVEDWGGKYQCQEIAAKSGINIDELLEKILLEAEMLELKANPNKKAVGSIIESSLDKGRGYVATVLVQAGTLKVGDVMLAGQYHGHVKAMFNERGDRITEAGPSEPAVILGLNGAPQAGDKFNIMSSEKDARQIANKREQLQREQGLRTQKHITLDEIGRRIAIGNFQELNVIVKGDVDGSIEALADSLIKLSTDEIQVNIIHKAVGQITEGDVLLATASNAIIVGFQVRPSLNARKLAEKEEIDIRLYSVIYQAIEELKSAMEGMLSPEIKEEFLGNVEVLEAFKITKVGTVAGCIVREGKIVRNAKIRIIRDGIVIYDGLLGSLKRYKDDAKEVLKGFECGLNIDGYNDIKIGDFIEAYQEIEVKKTL